MKKQAEVITRIINLHRISKGMIALTGVVKGKLGFKRLDYD